MCRPEWHTSCSFPNERPSHRASERVWRPPGHKVGPSRQRKRPRAVEPGGLEPLTPCLQESPKGFRERVIEHSVGRFGVRDHAGFMTHCSTALGYESRCGRRGSERWRSGRLRPESVLACRRNAALSRGARRLIGRHGDNADGPDVPRGLVRFAPMQLARITPPKE